MTEDDIVVGAKVWICCIELKSQYKSQLFYREENEFVRIVDHTKRYLEYEEE